MTFSTILADPPWPYRGTAVVGSGGRGDCNGRAAEFIQVGLADHYPSMSINAIKELPIASMADKQAHLYLWTTNSFMVEAHEIAEAWGFQQKTIIAWGKVKKDEPGTPSMKTGYYYRSATEHLLFCTRKNMRLRGPCRPTLFLLPRDKHSKKPDFFYELIEEQSPGPYLELFARRPRAGWDQWGNEIESTVTL